MKHCFILGTRPEIIKLSPLIRVAQSRKLDYCIIHTNQHYTASMDEIFFRELKLPTPHFNLHIGSEYHSTQTGKMLISLDETFRKCWPDVVYVEGDTNTVMAGALAASKEQNVTLAHVEAGLRSYDRTMPEEFNRIIADHLSDLLFAPTKLQAQILTTEGIDPKKIFVTGNTIVDAVTQHLEIAEQMVNPLDRYGLKAKSYAVLTMHRPGNVDDPRILLRLINAINTFAERMPVLFPVHPRTRGALDALKPTIHRNLHPVEPIGYLKMLRLMKQAKLIVTDSGGIQEEACVLRVPCITIRENTERPETLDVGGNVLVGSDEKKLIDAVDHFARTKIEWSNPFGDGHSAERMIDIATSHVA
ncbi:MAG: UDP-N-acetylglucosamine 2-epimerase (non-hydrolyzing) [Candidatus Kerfeldbacteria bacterium]